MGPPQMPRSLGSSAGETAVRGDQLRCGVTTDAVQVSCGANSDARTGGLQRPVLGNIPVPVFVVFAVHHGPQSSLDVLIILDPQD